MKVTLLGTNHTKEDAEIEVTIEKPLADGDDWSFTVFGDTFTISNLTEVMDFLRRMNRR